MLQSAHLQLRRRQAGGCLHAPQPGADVARETERGPVTAEAAARLPDHRRALETTTNHTGQCRAGDTDRVIGGPPCTRARGTENHCCIADTEKRPVSDWASIPQRYTAASHCRPCCVRCCRCATRKQELLKTMKQGITWDRAPLAISNFQKSGAVNHSSIDVRGQRPRLTKWRCPRIDSHTAPAAVAVMHALPVVLLNAGVQGAEAQLVPGRPQELRKPFPKPEIPEDRISPIFSTSLTKEEQRYQ